MARRVNRKHLATLKFRRYSLRSENIGRYYKAILKTYRKTRLLLILQACSPYKLQIHKIHHILIEQVILNKMFSWLMRTVSCATTTRY